MTVVEIIKQRTIRSASYSDYYEESYQLPMQAALISVVNCPS